MASCAMYGQNSLVAFPLTFAAAVNTRPGMKALPPLADLLHLLLPGGIILPVWEGKC